MPYPENDAYDEARAQYIGEMHTVWSPQYQKPCVVALWNDKPDAIIAHCRHVGAIYHEEGPDDERFVVVLRADIGPELYTETALQKGFKKTVQSEPTEA